MFDFFCKFCTRKKLLFKGVLVKGTKIVIRCKCCKKDSTFIGA